MAMLLNLSYTYEDNNGELQPLNDDSDQPEFAIWPIPFIVLGAVLTPPAAGHHRHRWRPRQSYRDPDMEHKWAEFAAERAVGVEGIREMRKRVREEQDRKKAERESREEAQLEANGMEVGEPVVKEETKQAGEVVPVVEKVEAKGGSKPEKDDVTQADDDDDAAEY
ncbi:hypothetical protein FIBSPDRAFT_964114 [Athelia psychrophila]|uniref:Uncharacterized protein n=1 Tax=Athelia psychrophila TaxID=1759441 RepID=A0A165Y7D9_9AGAM|nr:hypothetical protein FIBSPDRAFT_964114 [Fibularhizoctonia sp. CBS 109695]